MSSSESCDETDYDSDTAVSCTEVNSHWREVCPTNICDMCWSLLARLVENENKKIDFVDKTVRVI